MASLPAGSMPCPLQDSTRSKRRAVRRRQFSDLEASAPSQSKRLSATTKRFSARPPQNVGNLDHRVLQMRGHDFKVLLVEDGEFQLLGGPVHGSRSRPSLVRQAAAGMKMRFATR